MKGFLSVLIASLMAVMASAMSPRSENVGYNGPLPTTCGAGAAPNYLPTQWDAPQLVKTVANGTKWTVYQDNNTVPLLLVHMYGDSDYDRAYAYGSLLQDEINTLLPLVTEYLQEQINNSLSFLSEPFREWVETVGLELALNLTYELTKPYAPAYWEDMIQGVADGANVSYMDIAHVCMIPELVKAGCSIVGAWGQATASSNAEGGLVQLRALDWSTDGPFQMYPVYATWHIDPSLGQGYTHSILGWSGLLGAITGSSTSGFVMSEKLWDAYTGVKNIAGYPFNYLMADILRWDNNMDSALSRIATANRTCSIWLGLGSGAENTFKIAAYSPQLVEFFNPQNFPYYPPYHDYFPDLLFLTKHVQPDTSSTCMNDLINYIYTNVSAYNVYTYVTAMEETGDMHISVVDVKNNMTYVSNASPGDGHGNGVIPAYLRAFIALNNTELWNLPPPSSSTPAVEARLNIRKH